MQLEVKWFVSMLITNKLITADEANLLNQILGGDPDLATYSEKYLAQKISGLKQEDEQLWRKHIQSAVDLAREMAASGATPENAAEFSDVVIENASSKEINVTATHSERCTPKVEYPQFSSLTNDSNDQSFTLKHSSVYSDDANRNNNDLYDPEEDRSVLENLKILRRINSFFSLLLITGL